MESETKNDCAFEGQQTIYWTGLFHCFYDCKLMKVERYLCYLNRIFDLPLSLVFMGYIPAKQHILYLRLQWHRWKFLDLMFSRPWEFLLTICGLLDYNLVWKSQGWTEGHAIDHWWLWCLDWLRLTPYSFIHSFWVMIICGLIGGSQRFGEMYYHFNMKIISVCCSETLELFYRTTTEQKTIRYTDSCLWAFLSMKSFICI
jgi:hypothetical protein